MIRYGYRLFVFLLLPLTCLAEEAPELNADPHYNALGFFDVHLCNWPERPNFFKVLFSTEHYTEVENMAVYTPENKLLVMLDRTKFMRIKSSSGADKRVYMLDIDAPEPFATGWYSIDVTTTTGKHYRARDYVVKTRLERATALQPDDEQAVSLPVTLRWKAVPGAVFYQAFVRDEWSGKLVYKSKLLNRPEVALPQNKLEPGGYYSWSVHSRDTNGHILLGDFHMGSMSRKAYFTVVE